jgi:hypothetical protein
MGFYVPEDGIHHRHRREDPKSYIPNTECYNKIVRRVSGSVFEQIIQTAMAKPKGPRSITLVANALKSN